MKAVSCPLMLKSTILASRPNRPTITATGSKLRHPDPWKLSEPAKDPSPALKGTLSPSDGERVPFRAGEGSLAGSLSFHGSGCLSLLPVAVMVGLFGLDAKIVDFSINGQETAFMMFFLALSL